MEKYEVVRDYAKSILSEERYYHSKCVEERCVEYAKRYNADIEKARLVGIAHDIAKEMPTDEKIKFAKENNIKINDVEQKSPGLLHGPIGAKICEEKFGFSKDMVRAIEIHSTGTANMDMLSKILYVSDSTGVDRKYNDTEELHQLALKDIDQAILRMLDLTIKICLEKNKSIDIKTIEARNNYLTQ